MPTDLDPTRAVRDAYQSRYDPLVAQIAPLTGSVSEAERSVQTAFLDALDNPRAFALLEDQEGWLREKAERAARTLNQIEVTVDFDTLVTTARRRQRRRTTIRVALAIGAIAIGLALFLQLGLQHVIGGLAK
jgi:hypothetical protein